MPTAEEIQSMIDARRTESDAIYDRWKSGDRPDKATFLRLDMIALGQQLGEISTQRVIGLTQQLVSLTKALKTLTIALVVVSVVTIAVMVSEDFIAHSNQIQSGNGHQTPAQFQQNP